MEPASGPSVVVTPATPFSGISNLSVPPPIATREGSLDQTLGALETEKPAVATSTDTKPKPWTLLTTGTDAEMSDETQPQEVNTMGP